APGPHDNDWLLLVCSACLYLMTRRDPGEASRSDGRRLFLGYPRPCCKVSPNSGRTGHRSAACWDMCMVEIGGAAWLGRRHADGHSGPDARAFRDLLDRLCFARRAALTRASVRRTFTRRKRIGWPLRSWRLAARQFARLPVKPHRTWSG